jgi:exonuclease III
VEFLAIQETKMEDISASFCHKLWGGVDCDWAFLPSEGNSGGILSIWSNNLNTTNSIFVGEGYVGVCLDWAVLKHRCFVVNVYSKCDLSAKRRLWDRLVELRRSMGEGAWCILGDFNSVCRSGERRGANEEVNPSQREEIILFNTFLREVDLEDLNLLGRRFTWFHPNGRAMSRIDRVLISEEWANLWGDSSLWVLPRDVSDHCPLILKEAG